MKFNLRDKAFQKSFALATLPPIVYSVVALLIAGAINLYAFLTALLLGVGIYSITRRQS